MNSRNLDDLLDAIREKIDLSNAPTKMTAPDMHLAIVGNRNAGKSTLVNAIACSTRATRSGSSFRKSRGQLAIRSTCRVEKDGRTLA